MKSIFLSYLVFIIFITSSCFKIDDFEKIKKVELTPKVAASLTQTTVKMDDLFSNKDQGNVKLLNLDAEGNYIMTYKGKEIKENNVIDVNIPNINVTRELPVVVPISTPIPIPITHKIPFQVPITSPNVNGNITEVILSKGNLKLDVYHNLGGLISKIGLEVKSVVDPSGNIFKTNHSITNQDLTGYKIVTNGSKIEFEVVVSLKPTTTPITVAGGKKVKVDVQFNDLDYKKIKGQVGRREQALSNQTMDINFPKEIPKGFFDFGNANIKLEVSNGIGIPISLDLSNLSSFKAAKNATATSNATPAITKKLSGDIIDIRPFISKAAETSSGGAAPVKTTITLDGKNSNIEELLNTLPNKLNQNVNIIFNDKVPDAVNFVTKNADMSVKLSYYVPLRPKLKDEFISFKSDFTLKDTDVFEKFEKLTLILTSTNSIPIKFEMDIFFIDDKGNNIGNMFDKKLLIEAAKIDAEGNVTESKVSTFSRELKKTSLDKWVKAKSLLIKANLNTSEGKRVYINKKHNLKLLFKGVVEAKIEIQ